MSGLKDLRESCDTVIVIQNDKLLQLVPKLPLNAAFKVADEVLMQSIKGITEVLTKPGLVNVDFNDINVIMKNGGLAMIGMGESAEPGERVDEAVSEAMTSPLLGDIDLSSAKGAMVRVTGGPDMSVSEAEKVAELVSGKINQRAKLIWGCSIDPELKGKIKVLVVITGVKSTILT